MIEISIVCLTRMDGLHVFWKRDYVISRIDGPAVTYPDGDRVWYENGFFTKRESK